LPKKLSGQLAGIAKVSVALAMMFALYIAGGLVPAVQAQRNSTSDRKIVSTVKPAYPQTLKNLHIEGLVRLHVTVLPNGNVADIDVRGGNPILVENAVKAVKSWKYAPAASQTIEEVVLNFNDR
jgi:TonB family protein